MSSSQQAPNTCTGGFPLPSNRPLTGPYQLLRLLLVSLVLCVFGLLVLTANFMGPWRHTSVARGNFGENQEQDINGGKYMEGVQSNTQKKDDHQWSLLHEERSVLTAEEVKRLETQLVYTIHQTVQRTSKQRGIVLPMHDKIAVLGLSLIMELRAMSVDLPIEVPHCGDLKVSTQRAILKRKDIGVIRFYDVCILASQTTSLLYTSRKIFCQSLAECYKIYRSFYIKVLAVSFSQFEEIMLLDADTMFFESPTTLWDTEKYRTTGTLFFHDRVCQSNMYLGKSIGNNNNVTRLHDFISSFDVSPFATLGNIERPMATSKNMIPVDLKNYSPSEHLLTSHSWNLRSGHEMDSSLVLWNKKKQRRATAILAAFVARNDISRPSSYGDKELFYLAAELAETSYAFSDFGVGSVGWDLRDNRPGKSIICGHASHYYPVKVRDASAVINTRLLYLNSDDILKYDPFKKPIYYSQARLYEVYAGSFKERNLSYKCLFDVTSVRFDSQQDERILSRQRFSEITKAWIE